MIDSLYQLVNLKSQSSLIYDNLEVLSLEVVDVARPCAISLAPSATLSNENLTSSLILFY